jgi:hypothetical protein
VGADELQFDPSLEDFRIQSPSNHLTGANSRPAFPIRCFSLTHTFPFFAVTLFEMTALFVGGHGS